MAMINQQEREGVLQRIEKELLTSINTYCKEEGYIRNKLLERYIREGYIRDLNQRRKYEMLEELYNKEKKQKIERLDINAKK